MEELEQQMSRPPSGRETRDEFPVKTRICSYFFHGFQGSLLNMGDLYFFNIFFFIDLMYGNFWGFNMLMRE
jgi:hypothetical protein